MFDIALLGRVRWGMGWGWGFLTRTDRQAHPAPTHAVTGLGRPSGNLQVTQGTAPLAGPAAARRRGGESTETCGAQR